MMDNISTEQLEIFKTLEKRIRKRYARRTELLSHFIAFAVSMIIMWLTILKWLPDLTFWTIAGTVVTGGWVMGLLIHSVQILSHEMEDRAVIHEMERLGLLAQQKRKNEDQVFGLGNDGELVNLAMYDEEEHETNYG